MNHDISYLTPKKYPVALESVSVSGSVADFTAELTFELEFSNREDKNVEILYCFPLPNRAAVIRFAADDSNGGVAAVSDRENDYDRILDAGGAACRLELKEKNLLELALGNVPANSRMKITIGMLMPLELNDNLAVLRLPFALAPRYVPQTYNWTDNPVPSPLWHESVHYSFQLNLDIETAGVLRIHSPTHKIVSRSMNGFTRVSLGFPRSIPDRDLILELRLDKPIETQCRGAYHSDGKTVSARFIFAADFSSPPCPVKCPEIILMLDCSASMTSRRFEQALEAMELALRALAPGDYFNVVTFGGDCRLLSPASLPCNRKNLNAALEMLSHAHPNLGGTELLQTLKIVDKLPHKVKSNRNIILISDGEVYNTHELLHYVRNRKNHSPVFALMAGSSSGQSPLSLLSEFSGGFCEILHEESSVSEMILRQLSRIIQIPVRNIALHAVDAELEPPVFIPAVFEGDVYSLFLRLRNVKENPQIILEGKLRNRKINIKTPVILQKDSRIPLLQAASEINALENGDQKARENASALAARSGLLSPDNPLLTVHHQTPSELTAYYPAFRMVPLVLGAEHRRHRGGDQELMAAVHEEAAAYGGDFVMKLLKSHQADGTFAARELLADYLGIPESRLEQQIDRLLQRYFGDSRSEELRDLLLTLLALKELPKNRLTAPACRKVMSVVESHPQQALLLEAAEWN